MTNFNNETFEKYDSVGGWLTLLCFALVIGSPLRSIYNFYISYSEGSMVFDLMPSLKRLFYIDGILSALLMVLSIRAGIALWVLNPNAVRITKNYLFIFLGYSVIALILPFTIGLPAAANEAMIGEVVKGAFQSLAFFGIWFWYLNVSTRVKATYNL